MLTRFEYNIQNGKWTEISQVVYRNDEGNSIVLDSDVKPPNGFSEFTGELSELSEEKAMAGEEKPAGE